MIEYGSRIVDSNQQVVDFALQVMNCGSREVDCGSQVDVSNDSLRQDFISFRVKMYLEVEQSVIVKVILLEFTCSSSL